MIFLVRKEVRIPMGEDVLILEKGDRLEVSQRNKGESYVVLAVNGYVLPMLAVRGDHAKQLKGATNAVAKRQSIRP